MAATFTFAESHTTVPTVVDPATYINLLSANIASGSDATTAPAANPIVIPPSSTAYSYERWLRGHWASTFTSVAAITFCKHLGTLGTGVTVYAGNTGDATYDAPVNTVSSVATTNISTNDTTVADSSTLTSAGYSNYFVLQLRVASTASSGSIGTQTWQMAWNEVS